MRRYRLLVFVVILLVWAVPVHPSASSPVSAATGALDGEANPLRVDPTPESGVTVPENTDVVLDVRGSGSARGVAADARYYYGDPAAPIERPAFTITNTASTAHDLTLNYIGAADDNPAANVQFRLYDASGTQVAVITEEDNPVTIHGLPGEATLSVVVVVDTHGLTTADDLSGTLRLHV